MPYHAEPVTRGDLKQTLTLRFGDVHARYASPLTEDAIDQLVADRIEHLVAFTQYPQYVHGTDQHIHVHATNPRFGKLVTTF